MNEEILIAGGGIAGLSAALAIAQTGREIKLFEQSDALEEFGAGMQLGPNAARALEHLGIDGELDSYTACPTEVRILDGITGSTLNVVTLGDKFTKQYGAPYQVIHRGDLLKVLAKTCKGNGAIDVNLASPVKNVKLGSSGVSLKAGSKKYQGTALIGADGVRSTVRSEVLNDGGPQLTGHVIGRALVPGHIMPVPDLAVHLWMLPGGHVVHYPIRGGKDFNLVAAFDGVWDEDGWNGPATKDEIEFSFEMCTGLLRQVLAAAPHWRKWAGADRAPTNVWGKGEVTLVGDAAHAVLPYLAQGAAMALEDACELAQALDKFPVITSALRFYEAQRAPRVGRLQAESRRAGNIYHASGAMRVARNFMLRSMGEKVARSRLDWLYNWRP